MKRKQGNDEWQYAPLAERLAINTAALSGLALLGVTASFFFTPVILMTVSAYSAFKVSTFAIARHKKLREKIMKWEARKGDRIKLPDEHPFTQIVGDLSQQLERPKSPEIYMISEKALLKIQHLPFRRFLKNSTEKKIKKHFSADVFGDFLTVGNRAVNDNHYTSEELKFMAAHKMVHLKTDKFSLPVLADNLGSYICQSLALGTIVACAFSIAGIVAMPFAMTIGSTALAVGSLAGARIFSHSLSVYAAKRGEQRADRNALYLTGDIDSALSAIKKVSPPKRNVRNLWSMEFSNADRAKRLKRSFNTVAKYQEKKQTVVPMVTDKPKPKQKF